MKTLTTAYQMQSGCFYPLATIEIDRKDLEDLGVVKWDGYRYFFTGDPGEALLKLLGRERETLRKIVDDNGATEIVRVSLKRLEDYFIARGKLAPIPDPIKEVKST